MADAAITTRRFRYGDKDAALLMREAKHDPLTDAITHAARKETASGRVPTIHTDRWGQDGAPEGVRAAPEHERPGTVWSLRGNYRPSTQDIDVRRGHADGPFTLGHELGHYLTHGHTRRMWPGDPGEAQADALAGNPKTMERLPAAARDMMHEDNQALLGRDATRAPATPPYDPTDRVSDELEGERNSGRRRIIEALKKGGLDAMDAEDYDQQQAQARDAEPTISRRKRTGK